jgi:hypothetical protein
MKQRKEKTGVPRNPNKIRCSVPGCRAWAMRGSNPPRCSPHRNHLDLEGLGPPDPGAPANSALAKQPRPGAPPGNQNRLIHGFYARPRQLPDQQGRDPYAVDNSLDREIIAARVALDRILEMLHTGVTPGPDPTPLSAADYARYAGLTFQGASAISRLLRARQTLEGDQGGALSRIVDLALDGLGQELGVDL